MPGRHHMRLGIRARLRWAIAGAISALLAAGLVLGFSSMAAAASNVNAQLSLSGVATSTSIAGGSEIGVHPGDTVTFKASALPTVGLEKIPSLGPVLKSVLDGVLGQYQVVVSFGPSFPGGAKTVTLGGPKTGPCAGAQSVPYTFPDKGSYSFTWKVQYVLPLLLGCTKNGLSDSNLNLLAKAGVLLNADNQWVGKVVVADNPPKGGISIQLPGISVAPNIGGHQLPTLGVPGLQLPTLQAPVPDLNSGGGSGSGSGAGSGSGSDTGAGTAEIPIPALVVPHGDNAEIFGDGAGFANVLGGSGTLGGTGLTGGSGSAGTDSAAAVAAQPDTQPVAKNLHSAEQRINVAADRSSSGQLTLVLALLSVVALTLVAGAYAKLYLLRKP